MDELIHKRGTIKGRITRFKTFIAQYLTDPPNHYQELIKRKANIEPCYAEFEDIQSQVELSQLTNGGISEEQKKANEEERAKFETEFYSVTTQAESLINKFRLQNTDLQSASTQTLHVPGQVNLPFINLPTFDGSYEKWNVFCDTFKSIIDSNQQLSSVQKFHYLRSTLRGDALRVIENIETTNINYEIAWNLLKERYENKKLITHNHIKALFEIQSLPKENSTQLRQFLDTIQKHIRALKLLGQPTDSWNSLLLYLLATKLDISSRREWETKVSTQKDDPTFDEFCAFIKQKCQILETVNNTAQNTHITSQLTKHNTHLNKHNSQNNTHLVKQRTYPNTQFSKPFTHTNPYFQRSNTHSNTQFIRQTPQNLQPSQHSFSIQSQRQQPQYQTQLCQFCRAAPHKPFSCERFMNMSPQERQKEVTRLNLCLNCFSKSHLTAQCFSGLCRKCCKKHNTLLHIDENTSQSVLENIQGTSNSLHTLQANSQSNQHADMGIPSPSHFTGSIFRTSSHIILATAVVEVFNHIGERFTCRILLDSGSQINFVSKEACKKLGVTPKQDHIPVKGINGQLTNAYESTQLTIKSRFNSFKHTLRFMVVPKITDNLPIISLEVNSMHIPENITLADPEFHKPSTIDMLLGAEIYLDLLCIGQIKPAKNGPILQKTQFGWIVSGKLGENTSTNNASCHLNVSDSLSDKLQKFWELEEIQAPAKYTKEELDCENHFKSHFARETNGKFNVRLPFKENRPKLGNSYDTALKRFSLLEKRLIKCPELKLEYVKFMREYSELKHMRILKIDNKNIGFYLPHHPVFKTDSLTTKLRVVFDGSVKSTTGLSLNETLMKGPVVQDDLLSIILRFRLHNYVMTADIEKMYRQININECDAHYQKILWRENPEDELHTFLLTTVTYGTTSAPFLATRCLNQLALDHIDKYPLASKIVRRDFYVDDLLTGCDTIAEARQLQQDLSSLLQEGGLSLRKWRTNYDNKTFHNNNNSPENYSVPWDKLENSKTLGLIWNSRNDVFKFTYTNSDHLLKVTKRKILGNIARIFDPLGFLGPILTTAKLIMQRIWQLKLGWDESLPLSEHTKWTQLQRDLSAINGIQINRSVTTFQNVKRLELHGFCDASESAYGACVYVRASNETEINKVELYCSKSRVAPLKVITLPRLELCAALLLSRLISKIKASSHLSFDSCHLWTDSTIVLAWLAAPSNTWKTFVANRVAEIQEITQNCHWHHIKSEENPADCLSRGTFPTVLKTHKLWWNGPAWLSLSSQHWPQTSINQNFDINLEKRKGLCLTLTVDPVEDLFIKCTNSLTKLKRVVAYCLRFINNLKSKTKVTGYLTAGEINNALITLSKTAQRHNFQKEIHSLQISSQVNSSSKLLSLNPFLDENGLLRVGGRLRNSNISYTKKFPIVLPSNHKLTEMLINYEHIKLLHAGPLAVLASIRTEFWPLSGRNTVRRVLRKCITCFRNKPQVTYPFMGNLPTCRVSNCRPFINVGVDYAGPILLKESHRRGRVHTYTCYIAIFVCMATKAVHLELVNGLTSQAFIASLKRFMARRGKCLTIYSDNATNFVKANKELKKLEFLMNTSDSNLVTDFLANDHIEWKFIPARSPTFGGLWEAAVKSLKYHIRRITGNSVFTYEEYLTFLVQTEACLNSRPLTPLSNDPNDLASLTPGHFLIGDHLTTTPDQDATIGPVHQLNRYQLIQRLLQNFWKRWSVEYLTSLQQRSKWQRHTSTDHLQPGRLVILKDDNLRPLQWKLGRIVQTFPGNDGIVRVVLVKTANGEMRRAVNKVCPLPLDNDV